MKAWVSLRNELHYRRDAFRKGLEALGYEVSFTTTEHPGPRDLLVTWNMYGHNEACALKFKRMGRPVLVAENAAWGNEFGGDRWYSLARDMHNTAGRSNYGGPERWDSLGIDLPPFRKDGSEVVILPQRGIGPAGVAMPRGWAQDAHARFGGRIRPHPGKQPCKPLQDDLKNARLVVTWGSGAAIKALLMGVPVHSEMPGWIGQQDNTEAGRLEMFRRLAWSQWRLSEIESGEAFARLL
jgi:hypothetical protein